MLWCSELHNLSLSICNGESSNALTSVSGHKSLSGSCSSHIPRSSQTKRQSDLLCNLAFNKSNWQIDVFVVWTVWLLYLKSKRCRFRCHFIYFLHLSLVFFFNMWLLSCSGLRCCKGIWNHQCRWAWLLCIEVEMPTHNEAAIMRRTTTEENLLLVLRQKRSNQPTVAWNLVQPIIVLCSPKPFHNWQPHTDRYSHCLIVQPWDISYETFRTSQIHYALKTSYLTSRQIDVFIMYHAFWIQLYELFW